MKYNSYNSITSELAKREGKGSETSIGNIREIISKLIDMQAECLSKNEDASCSPLGFLNAEAMKRAKEMGYNGSGK